MAELATAVSNKLPVKIILLKRSLLSRPSSFLSTMYGKSRGLTVALQFKTPSMSKKSPSYFFLSCPHRLLISRRTKISNYNQNARTISFYGTGIIRRGVMPDKHSRSAEQRSPAVDNPAHPPGLWRREGSLFSYHFSSCCAISR
jgi:hypothetical protein